MRTRLRLVSLAATLTGSFHMAFQMGAPNAGASVMMKFFNETLIDNHGYYITHTESMLLWSAYISIFHIGAVFGAITIVPVTNRLGGRRTSMAISFATIFFLLPLVIARHCHSVLLAFLGRLLIGVTIGSSQAVTGTYLNELAPTRQRGDIGLTMSLMMRISYIISVVCALPMTLGTEDLWPYIYLIEMLVAVVQVPLLYFCPTSPTYSILCDQEENATAVIKSLHEENTQSDVDETISTIQSDILLQKERLSILQLMSPTNSTRAIRLGIMLGLSIAFIMPISGTMAVFNFSELIYMRLNVSHETATLCTLVVGVVALLATLITQRVIDKVGRRPMLIASLGGVLAIDIAMMGSMYAFQASSLNIFGWMFIVLTFLFTVAFVIGIGSIVWFIGIELVPINVKKSASSLMMVMLHVSAFFTGLVFLPLHIVAGPATFLMFILPVIAVLVFIALKLPETKLRNIANITAQLNNDTNVTCD